MAAMLKLLRSATTLAAQQRAMLRLAGCTPMRCVPGTLQSARGAAGAVHLSSEGDVLGEGPDFTLDSE